LKKANQKRMLGDVAIEGGNFTTASLQQGTIADLFAEPSGLNTLAERKPVHSVASSSSLNTVPANSVAPSLNEKQFEQALCQAEDVEDVRAAAVASEEAGAELAEFDENIPWDEREAELKKQQAETTSKVEMEIAMIEKELTPVERYAVIFLEKTDDQFTEEAVNEAEMDIEQAKKDWELNRLKSQREEEERKAELEEDDMLYTYSKEDGMNQVRRSPKKKPKQPPQRKRVIPEASRKSSRPPRPKQLDSDTDEEQLEPRKKMRKPGSGRPKGSKNKNTIIQESHEHLKLKPVVSPRDEIVTLQRKPGGGTTYILSSPITSQIIKPGMISSLNGSHQTSDNSDVDVEGNGVRRSTRHRSGSESPMKLAK